MTSCTPEKVSIDSKAGSAPQIFNATLSLLVLTAARYTNAYFSRWSSPVKSDLFLAAEMHEPPQGLV